MAIETIVEAQTIDGFSYNSTFGAFHQMDNSGLITIVSGNEYLIVWDGLAYVRTAYSFTAADGSECVGVGNTLAVGGEDSGEPFCIVHDHTRGDLVHYFSLDQSTEHVIGIYGASDIEIVLEAQTIDGFSYNSTFGAFHQMDNSGLITIVSGNEYLIVWDGLAYVRTAYSFTAADGSECVGVGNTLAVGGEDSGEPFCIVHDHTRGDLVHYFSLGQETEHGIGIYSEVESGGDEPDPEPDPDPEPGGDEPDPEPDPDPEPGGDEPEPEPDPDPEPEPIRGIVLKNYSGQDVVYENVHAIRLNTTDGDTQIFSRGQAIEGVEIVLDFTNETDQVITAEDGYLVKSAIIKLPEGLVAENIAEGITIAGIKGKHKGSTDGVCVVTFMSQDGETELFKRPVVAGDTAADPVSLELIPIPTKESDVAWDYTFIGWSPTPNGAWDEHILESVTANRTVYAAYASTPRMYNITFYDDDGTTVLATKPFAYGAVPSYNATKDGYALIGWAPELSPVTGETSYTASWVERVDFISASWGYIKRIADSGNASKVFSLGDTRTINFTYEGIQSSADFEIVAFNYDDKADGSGKAGLSICMKNLVSSFYDARHSTSEFASSLWPNCDLRNKMQNELFQSLPDDLKNVIAPVTKITSGYDGTANRTWTTTDTLWLPSSGELGGKSTSLATHVPENVSKFPHFTLDKSGANDYWLRTNSSNANVSNCMIYHVPTRSYRMTTPQTPKYIAFGFCI